MHVMLGDILRLHRTKVPRPTCRVTWAIFCDHRGIILLSQTSAAEYLHRAFYKVQSSFHAERLRFLVTIRVYSCKSPSFSPSSCPAVCDVIYGGSGISPSWSDLSKIFRRNGTGSAQRFPHRVRLFSFDIFLTIMPSPKRSQFIRIHFS